MSRNTITLDVQLVLEECCQCGMVFAVSSSFQRQRQRQHDTFYCPAGHGQAYTGKSDLEQAQADIEKYRRLWKEEANYAASVVSERNAAQRSLRATKGQLTKTKKRIANGVCPCCRRHFVNLERHMTGQHPDYTKE